MTVEVDRWYGFAAHHALFQPRLIASRGQGVVVPAAPEVDALDIANAELGALGRFSGDVIGWSNQRTDWAGMPHVEADSAQGPNVSHGVPDPSGERLLQSSSLFGPGHACLTCYRGPSAGAYGLRDLGATVGLRGWRLRHVLI